MLVQAVQLFRPGAGGLGTVALKRNTTAVARFFSIIDHEPSFFCHCTVYLLGSQISLLYQSRTCLCTESFFFFLGISPYQVIQELLGQIGKRSGAFARAFGQRSTSTQNVHKYSTVVFPSPKKFAEIATRAYIIVLAYDQWSKYTVVPVNISTDCLVADQADLQYRCPTTAIKRVYCEDAIFGHKEQDERYGP